MDEGWHNLLDWWGNLTRAHLAFSIALPVIVFLLRGVLGKLCVLGIAGLVGRFGVSIDQSSRDDLVRASGGILVFFAIYIGFASLELPLNIAVYVLLILQSLLICSVFWLINAIIQVFLAQISHRGVRDERFIESWISQIVPFFLIAVMVVTVLGIWGVDLGPALTGVGIAGAVAALAAQDFVRNVVAGFSIAGEGRFREGDWIHVSPELEGFVEKVELRSTIIRRFDNAKEHIPNSELAYKPLSNFSRRPSRRLRWTVPLKLGSDTEALNKICVDVKEYILSNALFGSSDDNPSSVTLYAFGESSIDLLIDCYTSANLYEAELAARHDLIIATKGIVEKHGAEIALPSRDIYFDADRLARVLAHERFSQGPDKGV